MTRLGIGQSTCIGIGGDPIIGTTHVDALALYKINVLHLHLSDDQGWRIEIRSRPQLAQVGGSTQVGGGPGGYYTQEEYADLVRYAQERYITIVPEIDMPAHTNAALVAFPMVMDGAAGPGGRDAEDERRERPCRPHFPLAAPAPRHDLGELAHSGRTQHEVEVRHALEGALPRVERLLDAVSTEMGDIARDMLVELRGLVD